MPRNQKLTKVIAGRTIKAATTEPGGLLILLDDQSSMKIKTAATATFAAEPKLKERRIRPARLREVSETEEESADGYQPQDAGEDQDPGQDRRQIPCCQGGQGRDSGGEKVARPPAIRKCRRT